MASPKGREMSEKQLKADILWLAKRQRALEDAISEWSEFMTAELLKNGIRIHKHQTSDRYFKHSLQENFKKFFDGREDILLKIKQLFGKHKPTDTNKLNYVYKGIGKGNNNTE